MITSSFRQDGRPRAIYGGVFRLFPSGELENPTLNACFQMGLEDEVIRFLSPGHCDSPLVVSIKSILWVNGSDLLVGEVKENNYNPQSVQS